MNKPVPLPLRIVSAPTGGYFVRDADGWPHVWTWTLWGARWKAKRMLRRIESNFSETVSSEKES